jgi:hypothetical protein
MLCPELRIVMCAIIRGAVMFDGGQRQPDPQDRPPPSLPTISPLRIALRTRRTSPLSQSDLVPWRERALAGDSLTSVGLRPPPSAYPRRNSHPHCRCSLILIVARAAGKQAMNIRSVGSTRSVRVMVVLSPVRESMRGTEVLHGVRMLKFRDVFGGARKAD